MSSIGFRRTHYCGNINESLIGREVRLSGWVQRARDLGGVIFIWLRDREGLVQLVFDAAVCGSGCFALGGSLRSEYVVSIEGEVRARAPETVNKSLPTGAVEVFVKRAVLLNESETPPIYIDDKADENETVRLKFRYLDLRRASLREVIRLRHRVVKAIRAHFDENGFIEIETPILTKSTPEGARDYLVPSRVHSGQFYALPQSPQIYKQLLMLAGFDKYYQIARCFRDEDSRSDRQPEFSQLDMEMSFVEPVDVQSAIEGAFAAVFREVKGIELPLPLPRMTWQHAMERYGSDKPDTRFGLELTDVSDAVRGLGFPVFDASLSAGGKVRGVNAKGLAEKLTRKELDSLAEYVKTFRASGLAWMIINPDGSVKSSFNKFLTPELKNALCAAMDAAPGDALMFVADKNSVTLKALGALRLEAAKRYGLIPPGQLNLLWVTEFPLLELNEEDGTYSAMHHPFTSAMDEDAGILSSDPGGARAKAYDLVFNGIEMGSGSIRIHQPDMQARMFELLGLSEDEVTKRFGFLLEAFKYGAPPHGGFAFGIDRLVMALTGCESLRDTMAFPKAHNANCLMMETPSDVNAEQLAALGLKFSEYNV